MKLCSFLFVNLLICTWGTQVLDSRSFSAEKNFEIFVRKSKLKSAKTEFILNGFRSIPSIWPTKETDNNQIIIPYRIDNGLPLHWRKTIKRVIDGLNIGKCSVAIHYKAFLIATFKN